MTTIGCTNPPQVNLVFFGIQGSGKGTQAKLLAEEFGFSIFETGRQLRELAEEMSPLGQKIKKTIEAGDLVSSELVIEILKNFIEKNEDNTIIFDGIPRNEEQSELFQALLKDMALDYTGVHFTLSKEESMNRLMKRAEIEGRADDNEESIKKRIDIFYTQTAPVIEELKEAGKMIEIDAGPSIEDIAVTLQEKLELHGN